MAQNSLRILLFNCISFLLLAQTVLCVEVFTQNSKGQQVDIIKKGIVQGSWDYKAGTGHTCRPPASIIENSEQSTRAFTIANTDSESIEVDLKLKEYDQVIMGVTIDVQSDHILSAGEKKEVKLSYNCVEKQFAESEIGWNRVAFELKVKKNNQIENLTFSLLKVCNPPAQKYDSSIFILMGVSIFLVAIGAYQSEKPIIVESEEQTQVVTKSHALFFIVGGSVMLVVMFFLYEYMEIGLLIVVMISSFSSISLLLNDCFEKLMSRLELRNQEFACPLIEKATVAGIVSAGIALGIVVVYVVTRSWIVSNLIAFCTIIILFKVVRLPSYMIGLLLLGMAFLYDIFWVFYSDNIFGTSVMANVATKVDLPMMFLCPKLTASPVQNCSLIGLGDIVLPGIFVAFCLRFSRKSRGGNSYYLTCLAGYILGLAICVVCLTVYKTAQPALLYLSPCTLIPVAIHALINKEFTSMWKGIKSNNDEQNEDAKPESQMNRNPLAFQPLEFDEQQNQNKRKKSF